MKTQALSIVRRLFNSEYASRHTNRRNRLEWVKAKRALGANHVLDPRFAPQRLTLPLSTLRHL